MCGRCAALEAEVVRLRREASALRDELAEWRRREDRLSADGGAADRLARWQDFLGLQPVRARLLIAMVDRAGRVCSHDHLFEATRGSPWAPDEVSTPVRSIIGVHVHFVRSRLRALAASGELPDLFLTPGAGIDVQKGAGFFISRPAAEALRRAAGDIGAAPRAAA